MLSVAGIRDALAEADAQLGRAEDGPTVDEGSDAAGGAERSALLVHSVAEQLPRAADGLVAQVFPSPQKNAATP